MDLMIVRFFPFVTKTRILLDRTVSGIVISITPVEKSGSFTTARNPSCARAFITVFSSAPVMVQSMVYVLLGNTQMASVSEKDTQCG